MALYFVMGTAGELIKMYPLIHWAESQRINWRCLHTGQSGVNFWRQWDDFSLDRKKAISLENTESDLQDSASALKWFLSTLLWRPSSVRQKIADSGLPVAPGNPDILFVHGDTLSTLVGAWLGWRLEIPIAHVEAGLRSQFLFQPFPEEINRRLVSEFVTWHFCPDDVATHNLKQAGFEEHLFNTGGNTLIDAIRLTLSDGRVSSSAPYAVANLHRHENLSSNDRWRQLVEVTLEAQKICPVEFVMHPPTERKLQEDPVNLKRLQEAGVRLSPRKRFSEFIRLLNGAQFVLSDGGSNQEECSYLGVPCLLMRETTERVEGLGENVVMSYFDPEIIQNFLKNPDKFHRSPQTLERRPTEIIFRSLGLIAESTP